MKIAPYLVALSLLSACNIAPASSNNESVGNAADAANSSATASSALAFADAPEQPGFTETPTLRAQVILDHLGFSPGVIDGKEGQSYIAALRGFQTANKLDPSGKLDAPTLKAMEPWHSMAATRMVTIPPAFANGPFVPDLPRDAAAQAKLPALGYRNLLEALSERFHTTPDALIALNAPSTVIGPNQALRVPNVGNAEATPAAPDNEAPGHDNPEWMGTLQKLGVAANQPIAAKVVVDKSESVLRAFDADGKLIAQFPATMGSKHDPLPIGTWKIQGVSRNPEFHYNPRLFWDVSNSKDAQLLPPGPNGPVGVVWLDLSKPHYGIHGTSEPHTIGRAESHGCVRLTNWDAARLAQMTKPGTPAIFQE